MTGTGTWDPLGYTGIMLNKLNTKYYKHTQRPTRPVQSAQNKFKKLYLRRSIPIQKDLKGSQLEAAPWNVRLDVDTEIMVGWNEINEVSFFRSRVRIRI